MSAFVLTSSHQKDSDLTSKQHSVEEGRWCCLRMGLLIIGTDILKDQESTVELVSSPWLHKEALCSVNQFPKATFVRSLEEATYHSLILPRACLRETMPSIWTRNPCERYCRKKNTRSRTKKKQFNPHGADTKIWLSKNINL